MNIFIKTVILFLELRRLNVVNSHHYRSALVFISFFLVAETITIYESEGIKIPPISMKIDQYPGNSLVTLTSADGNRQQVVPWDVGSRHEVIAIGDRPAIESVTIPGIHPNLPSRALNDIDRIMESGYLPYGCGWYDWFQGIPGITRKRIIWHENLGIINLAGFGFGYEEVIPGTAEKVIFFRPPVQDPRYDASNFYGKLSIPGQSIGRTSYIGPDGRSHSVKNMAPIGAYTLGAMLQKIKNTLYVASLGLSGITVPRIQGARRYDASWREEIGMYISSLPLVLSPWMIAVFSRTQHELYPDESYLYGLWIAKSIRGLRRLHENGMVHNQYHPGNKYLAVGGGSNDLVITDFATLQHIQDHGNSVVFPKIGGILTPRQIALRNDVVHALSLDIGLFLSEINLSPSHHLPVVSDPNKIIDLTLELCAWAICAYDGSISSVPQVEIIRSKKEELYEYIKHTDPTLFSNLWKSTSNKREFIVALVDTAFVPVIRSQFPKESAETSTSPTRHKKKRKKKIKRKFPRRKKKKR